MNYDFMNEINEINMNLKLIFKSLLFVFTSFAQSCFVWTGNEYKVKCACASWLLINTKGLFDLYQLD